MRSANINTFFHGHTRLNESYHSRLQDSLGIYCTIKLYLFITYTPVHLYHLFGVWRNCKPLTCAHFAATSFRVALEMFFIACRALLFKAKTQYLLTLQVSRYCLLAMQSIVELSENNTIHVPGLQSIHLTNCDPMLHGMKVGQSSRAQSMTSAEALVNDHDLVPCKCAMTDA